MAKTYKSILVLRLRDTAPLFVVDRKYYPIPLPALKVKDTEQQMTDNVCLAQDWSEIPEYMKQNMLEKIQPTYPEAKFVRYSIEITEE